MRDLYGWKLGASDKLCAVSTVWTDIRRAQGEDEEARRACEVMANRYARPLYHAFKAGGMGVEDARDAMQDFMVRLVDGTLLKRVREECGSFRSFLNAALRNYLTDFRRRASHRKTEPLTEESAVDRFSGPEAVLEEGWVRELAIEVHRRVEGKLERGSLEWRLNDWMRRDPQGFGAASEQKMATRFRVKRGELRYAIEKLRDVLQPELTRLLLAEVASGDDFACERARFLDRMTSGRRRG